MDIRIGQLYRNKTLLYLLPCLSEYGETFKVKLNSIFNLAFGIHDCVLDGTVFEEQRLFYILCDKLYQPAKFQNFLNYVKVKDYFVTDYAFDDMEQGRKHMIVIKCPESMCYAYDMFNESKYSLMYLGSQIDSLFINNHIKDILKRKRSLAGNFAIQVNDLYNTSLTAKDVIKADMELDLPLNKKEEFFNYQTSKV